MRLAPGGEHAVVLNHRYGMRLIDLKTPDFEPLP
jgi:hypothetical protein